MTRPLLLSPHQGQGMHLQTQCVKPELVQPPVRPTLSTCTGGRAGAGPCCLILPPPPQKKCNLINFVAVQTEFYAPCNLHPSEFPSQSATEPGTGSESLGTHYLIGISLGFFLPTLSLPRCRVCAQGSASSPFTCWRSGTFAALGGPSGHNGPAIPFLQDQEGN